MSTVALLVKLAPEFADVDPTVLQPFLDQAILIHDAGPWGARYSHAMAYYAAHLYKSTPPDPATGTGGGGSSTTAGATGGVTSQRDGDLSRNYANQASGSGGGSAATAEEAELMATWYGRRYLALRKTLAVRAPRVITI